MAGVFSFVLVAALVAFIVSIINPLTFSRFGIATRKRGAIVFISIFIVSFVIIGITYKPISDNTSDIAKQEVTPTTQSTNTVIPTKIIQQTTPIPIKPTVVKQQQTTIAMDLTGYGATKMEWSKHHIADTSKVSGTAFDRQSNGNDEVAGVQWNEQGRVYEFSVQLPQPMSLNESKGLASTLLPTDADVIFDHKHAGCEFIQYDSKSVRAAMQETDLYIDVEFFDSKSPDVYDTSNTNSIIFAPGIKNTDNAC